MHSHVSYLSSLDENDEICIWSDSNAYSLHPAQLKMDAGYLINGVAQGLQGIVLTDSLFMIRELLLLADLNDISVKIYKYIF